MPRYEKQAQKGVAYIDVRISDDTVITTRALAGKAPTTKRATYGSVRMAAARFTKAIASAQRKGYVHALRTRPRNAALEHAIEADPDDDDARIVYGDWLLERGDPRGELIAVQARVARGRARERELLDDHSSEFYGAFDELLHERDHAGRAAVRVVWRLGFFDEVELRLSEPDRPDELTLGAAVERLVALPSARFLRCLVLGRAARYAKALQAVARLPPTLRSLTITGQLWGEYTPETLALGSLDAVCVRHRGLERLALSIDRDPLDGLDGLTKLQELDLWTNQLTTRQVTAVGNAAWPALTTLGLAIGSSATAKIEQVARLLDASRFPELAHLRLGRLAPDHAAELGASLANSKLGRQLATLTLVECDDDAVRALRAVTKIPVTSQPRES